MFLKKFLTTLTVGILATTSLASGKFGDEFYSNGVGARALALGGAFVSFEGDVNSVFWNPSGIAKVRSFGASVMHAEKFGGELMFDHFSALYPVSDFTLGFSYVRSSVDGILDTRNGSVTRNSEGQITDIDFTNINEFSDTDQLFNFAFGREWNEKLSVGANFKVIHRSIAEFSANGFGIDISGLYKIRENWRVGANLQNATTTIVNWNKGASKEYIRPLLKVGTSYDLKRGKNRFTFALDTDNRFEGRDYSSQVSLGALSLDFRIGVEYSFAELVFLRFGVDDVERLNFGAGFKIAKYFTVDYAISESGQSEDLGRAHRFSLNFLLN